MCIVVGVTANNDSTSSCVLAAGTMPSIGTSQIGVNKHLDFLRPP